MDSDSPAQITERALRDLNSHMRNRSVEGFLDMFADDAVLFGSEADEHASGTVELQVFISRIFARAHTFGWTWEAITARRANGWIWFVAPATVVLHEADGSEVSAPYRLSGVLEQSDGGWEFALFNGSEPAAPVTRAS